MKITKKFRTLSLIFAVIFGLLWSRGETFASSQSYYGSCAGTGGVSLSYTCSGSQEFPDDGNGNVPVTISNLFQANGALATFTTGQYYFDQVYQIGSSTYMIANFGDGLVRPYDLWTSMGQFVDEIAPIQSGYGYDIIYLGSYNGSVAFYSDGGGCSGQDFQTCANNADVFSIGIIPPNMIQSTSTMPIQDSHFIEIFGIFLALMVMFFVIYLIKGQKRI